MPQLNKPKFQAGLFVGEDPGTGILAVVAGDGSVQAVKAWNVATGDISYIAPSGTNAGGGTRRHLFDGDVYANVGTRAVPNYVNVRAWAAMTGTPTTVQGYGITNGARTDAANTFAADQTVTGTLTVTNGVANAAATGTLRLPNSAAIRWRNAANNANLGMYLAADNTLTTEAAMSIGGNVMPTADAAFDVGGANRFRDLSLSRNIAIGGNLSFTGNGLIELPFQGSTGSTIFRSKIASEAQVRLTVLSTGLAAYSDGTGVADVITRRSGVSTFQIAGANGSSVKTDSDVTLMVGAGGTTPTANHLNAVTISVATAVGFLGDAEVRYARHNTNIWRTGIRNTTGGASTATDDLQFIAGTTVVAALSQAGALTLADQYLARRSVAMTNGAGAAAGTLTNAPAAGNPTKWLPVLDNGVTRYVPAW